MAARGISIHAVVQPVWVTCRFSSGLAKMAARGTKAHAIVRPGGGIWKYTNGRARTAARKNDTGNREAAARYREHMQAADSNGYSWDYRTQLDVVQGGQLVSFIPLWEF